MNVTAIDFVDYLKDIGKLWYLVNPYETTFESSSEVPDYHQQIWLPFFVLIVLEQLILSIKGKKAFRLNDQVTSFSQWVFHETVRIFSRGIEYYTYIAIYEKYRLWNQAWDSLWTWYIAVIGVDFCYYWAHRSNHEIHFLWAYHQVHHSSEEFNLAVGLRQSVLQHWCNFIIYLPLALFLPPSHFIAHNQFNLIYQLWIHTTVIDDLGPLEYVFNTPKHHRVHHGCNLYCLDKNYGGVLIIWDRLFGTFQKEKQKNEIIYGLVVNPKSFNTIYLQTFYVKQLMQKCVNMNLWNEKLAVLWKGPSWFPGGPRLGLDEYKINVTSRPIYDVCISLWQNLYIFLHFCIVILNHFRIYNETQKLNNFWAGFIVANNLITLTSIGLLFDKYAKADIIEFLRCVIYLNFANRDNLINIFIYYVHTLSCCAWILHFLLKIRLKSNVPAE